MSNLLNVFLKISHKTMQFNELQTVLGGGGGRVFTIQALLGLE